MLQFSKSEVDKFRHQNKALRWGQAFYKHFKLHKVEGSDKAFCEKLYNASEEVAKAMVASRTDKTQ